jgi:hypothetical protein
LFEHFYNAGGGYGDPIERDPELVRKDLENGIVTPKAAKQIYHVDVHSDDDRTYKVDGVKTEQSRSEERSARLAEGIPVSEWLKQERNRILNHEFVLEVQEMYRNSMQLSPRWKDEFATFWQLPESFSI